MKRVGTRLLLFALALGVLVAASSWSEAAGIRRASGEEGLSWQVATGAAGLLAMGFVVAAMASEPVSLRDLPRRLADFAGVVLLLAIIMLTVGAVTYLLGLAAGLFGIILGIWLLLWVVARTIFAPAETLLGGRGPMDAVTASWHRSRGLAFFIGGAVFALGIVSLPVFSAVGHMPSWWEFFGNAATQAALQSTLVIVFWRWAQDAGDVAARPHGPREQPSGRVMLPRFPVPTRLVADAPGPDDAVLVRLKTPDDLHAIRLMSRKGAVWAAVQTRDQRLMADAVQEGVQVFVLDQRARLALGLNQPSARMASREADCIHWAGHHYVPMGDVWMLEPTPRAITV